MSTWSVEQIATWAKVAGWKGSQVVDAVSVAMATSNGDDHYQSNPGYAAALERRGLYGLTAAESAPTDVAMLFDPMVNTGAAFRHWQAQGGSWAWHPAWASGAAVAARDAVTAVLTGPSTATAANPATGRAVQIDYQSRFQTAMTQAARGSVPGAT